jgi:hypothetical protein
MRGALDATDGAVQEIAAARARLAKKKEILAQLRSKKAVSDLFDKHAVENTYYIADISDIIAENKRLVERIELLKKETELNRIRMANVTRRNTELRAKKADCEAYIEMVCGKIRNGFTCSHCNHRWHRNCSFLP